MSIALPQSARALVEGGALGHLVTLNRDGSPQVAIVWVGVDGDELVTAHLSGRQQKLKNVSRDPRVVVSFEAPSTNAVGMRDYLVVHGHARTARRQLERASNSSKRVSHSLRCQCSGNPAASAAFSAPRPAATSLAARVGTGANSRTPPEAPGERHGTAPGLVSGMRHRARVRRVLRFRSHLPWLTVLTFPGGAHDADGAFGVELAMLAVGFAMRRAFLLTRGGR